jgi:hypothetical protein
MQALATEINLSEAAVMRWLVFPTVFPSASRLGGFFLSISCYR